MDVSLEDTGWGIVTEPGAKKRDWMGGSVNPAKVKDWAREAVINQGAAKVAEVVEAIRTQHGEVSPNMVMDALTILAQEEVIAFYTGEPDQTTQPTELKTGAGVLMENVGPTHTVITKAKAAERAWLKTATKTSFRVDPGQSRQKLLPLIKRLGSVFLAEGGKSTVDYLDVYDLALPGGGRLRIQLENAGLADMKHLQEFFEVLMSAASIGPETQAELEINDPIKDCALINKLKGA